MKFTAKNAARPWGFTLIELLTVIAIIAVLATLLSSSLASAKRKARKTSSISNLRQIALAYQLYSDDHQRRPFNYTHLLKGYLTARVLACPEDKSTNSNWAGMIESASLMPTGTPIGAPVTGDGQFVMMEDSPHSYFKSFHLDDAAWEIIERSPMGGVAACQLHGIGKPNWEYPSVTQFQGLILRAVKDGSVIPRQVFWNQMEFGNGNAAITTSPSTDGRAFMAIPFFTDPVQ